MTLADLLDGHTVTDMRRETLTRAIALGASAAVVASIRDAEKAHKSPLVVLPAQHLQSLSRGRGWATLGRGDDVFWGERTPQGNYRVGPGLWHVGATDGFHRRSEESWRVKHVPVGDETWTIASRI